MAVRVSEASVMWLLLSETDYAGGGYFWGISSDVSGSKVSSWRCGLLKAAGFGSRTPPTIQLYWTVGLHLPTCFVRSVGGGCGRKGYIWPHFFGNVKSFCQLTMHTSNSWYCSAKCYNTQANKVVVGVRRSPQNTFDWTDLCICL